MVKVLFICYGNICRSPMAEFVMKDMVKKLGKENDFYIASASTSTEEIGNPVHYGTRNKLNSLGISTDGKVAVQLTKADYAKYDYILAMEDMNIRAILRIIGSDPDNKVSRLLDFSKNSRNIADPWYTGDFDTTYNDIHEGITAFLEYLERN